MQKRRIEPWPDAGIVSANICVSGVDFPSIFMVELFAEGVGSPLGVHKPYKSTLPLWRGRQAVAGVSKWSRKAHSCHCLCEFACSHLIRYECEVLASHESGCVVGRLRSDKPCRNLVTLYPLGGVHALLNSMIVTYSCWGQL